MIDHSSLFNDPTLVGLPNLRRAGDVVEITDLKNWETALEGPVTASNACRNQDAYFLRVGSAKVLKGNRLRFIDPLTNKPFGTILDGRFPLPRSPRPWSVVDYSSVNIPVSGALGQTGDVGAVIICPC